MLPYKYYASLTEMAKNAGYIILLTHSHSFLGKDTMSGMYSIVSFQTHKGYHYIEQYKEPNDYYCQKVVMKMFLKEMIL